MRTLNPRLGPRFTETSKVARSWTEKVAEEQGSLFATAAIFSLLELCSRLIRSCREATSGVTSALDARAAVYLAAAVAAGAACGSPTGALELSPCS
jgi:hypothetical protein